MTNALLTCISCKDTFRNRYELNYHVKRYHQSSVKVKYENGRVTEVKKGDDGTFKCQCGKRFKAPTSLRKHAKNCRHESSEDVNMLEEVSDASDMMDDDDASISDTPVDCFGALISREKY
jgi:hypothetical protein